MPSPDPGGTYLVGGAGLPLGNAPPGFRFETARGFQSEAIEWIQEEQAPVGLLAAPTGAGKTSVIASLAESSQRILCLYPTNALTEAQAHTLEAEHDLSVEVLNGRTLEQRGAARSEEVMGYADDPGREDVVITNPDVLQAIIGDQYISPGSELLRFFSFFDAAVYDEFHYYDPLAASGMLLQIKVLYERGKYRDSKGVRHFPRVLLSSATPAQSFVDHVSEDLELSVRRLRSELASLDLADPGPDPKSAIAYDTYDVSEASLRSDEELRGSSDTS
jgi:CRISPR-associated endonuclease/helicase Cas3